jgi:hypothetical protein
MDRTREEGSEIPHAVSEFEALALMRKFAKRVFPTVPSHPDPPRLKSGAAAKLPPRQISDCLENALHDLRHPPVVE